MKSIDDWLIDLSGCANLIVCRETRESVFVCIIERMGILSDEYMNNNKKNKRLDEILRDETRLYIEFLWNILITCYVRLYWK